MTRVADAALRSVHERAECQIGKLPPMQSMWQSPPLAHQLKRAMPKLHDSARRASQGILAPSQCVKHCPCTSLDRGSPLNLITSMDRPRMSSWLIRSAGRCRCAGSDERCGLCAPPLLILCHGPRTLPLSPPSCVMLAVSPQTLETNTHHKARDWGHACSERAHYQDLLNCASLRLPPILSRSAMLCGRKSWHPETSSPCTHQLTHCYGAITQNGSAGAVLIIG